MIEAMGPAEIHPEWVTVDHPDRCDPDHVSERFEIRVQGRLGPAVASSFEGLTARHEETDTVLSGCFVDQAALYGAIDRLHALGLELVGVRRLDP